MIHNESFLVSSANRSSAEGLGQGPGFGETLKKIEETRHPRPRLGLKQLKGWCREEVDGTHMARIGPAPALGS